MYGIKMTLSSKAILTSVYLTCSLPFWERSQCWCHIIFLCGHSRANMFKCTQVSCKNQKCVQPVGDIKVGLFHWKRIDSQSYGAGWFSRRTVLPAHHWLPPTQDCNCLWKLVASTNYFCVWTDRSEPWYGRLWTTVGECRWPKWYSKACSR